MGYKEIKEVISVLERCLRYEEKIGKDCSKCSYLVLCKIIVTMYEELDKYKYLMERVRLLISIKERIKQLDVVLK